MKTLNKQKFLGVAVDAHELLDFLAQVSRVGHFPGGAHELPADGKIVGLDWCPFSGLVRILIDSGTLPEAHRFRGYQRFQSLVRPDKFYLRSDPTITFALKDLAPVYLGDYCCRCDQPGYVPLAASSAGDGETATVENTRMYWLCGECWKKLHERKEG